MRLPALGAAMLMAAGMPAALAPANAADAGQTPQALFNTAQAAFDRNDWPAAVAGYRAALAALKPSARSAAVLHARLATALLRTDQREAAEQEAKLSISAFTGQNVTKDDDLAFAYFLLGNLHRGGADNDRAVAEYQHAIAATEPTSDTLLAPRYGLAIATLTTNPDQSASTLDAILADTAAFAKMAKADQANIYATRGMADLNRGQAKAAAGYIEKALTLAGRTSERVTINQVRIRGNAALIYAKLGNDENVRQYLTYSGAGHMPDDSWLSSAEKDLPVCDSELRPQDFAVVEFAIGDDGRVRGANALYASRPGPVGAAFAAAVNTWRWQPAVLAKLNPFWRASIRLELRCVKRPPLLALSDAFREATAQWLTKSGYDPELAKGVFNPHATDTAAVPRAFVAFWKSDSGRDEAAAGAALNVALAAANAPTDVRAFALFLEARPQHAATRNGYHVERAKMLAASIRALDGLPGAERAQAWFRTEQGLGLETGNAPQSAKAVLQSVVALPVAKLGEDDPIRSLAVLHLALIEKRSGAPALADKRLNDAGIDAEQCSLLDVRPVARNTEISSSVFPTEAVNWHFEGSVREAFDIAADGRVEGVRTVLSYPPFVFGPATEKAVAQFRYLPPTLGDQVLGCVGETVNVRFRLPN